MQKAKQNPVSVSKPPYNPPGAHLSWHWVTERGLRIATGETTLACYKALVSRTLPEVEDVIPADGSLLLIMRRGAGVPDSVWDALAQARVTTEAAALTRHELVVEYGGANGPDLLMLADQAGLEAAEYIRRHAEVEYTVAFLGFQPGFPYLRGLPAALHAPRRASPRVRVAAGSVAVGGTYAGIYPTSGPGGWRIIGRTAAILFDAQRDAPALLMPGDRLRFVPA